MIYLAYEATDYDNHRMCLIDAENDQEAEDLAIERFHPGTFSDKPSESDFDMDDEDDKYDFESQLSSWEDGISTYKKDLSMSSSEGGFVFIKSPRHSHKIDY